MPVALLKGSLGRVVVIDELVEPVDRVIGFNLCPVDVLGTRRPDSTAESSTWWPSIIAITVRTRSIIAFGGRVGGAATPR